MGDIETMIFETAIVIIQELMLSLHELGTRLGAIIGNMQ